MKIVVTDWYRTVVRTDIILVCLPLPNGRKILITEEEDEAPGMLYYLSRGSVMLWGTREGRTTYIVVLKGNARVSKPGVITVFARGGFFTYDEDDV